VEGAVAEAEAEDVDFEAAIDAVRPARIEMDFEPEKPEAARPVEPTELTASGALSGAGLEVDDTPAKPHRPPTARRPSLAALRDVKEAKVVTLVAGGLLVVTALVAGVLMFANRDATPADGGADRAVDAEIAPPAGGGAGAEEGAAVMPAQIDSAGRETLGVISQFYGRAVALDDGRATCEDLAMALIAVENAWLGYNADYKAKFTSPLPDALAERDERLYAGMRDVERLFEESECTRP
jgi:hypothetical protein